MFAAKTLQRVSETIESALNAQTCSSRVEQRNALTLLSKLAAPSTLAVAEGTAVAVAAGAAVFPRLAPLGERLEAQACGRQRWRGGNHSHQKSQ